MYPNQAPQVQNDYSDLTLTEYMLKKLFGISIDAIVMEEYKFVNSVGALEALMSEELEEHEVMAKLVTTNEKGEQVVEKKKIKYEDYVMLAEAAIKKNDVDISNQPRRDFKIALVKFTELARIVKHRDPVMVLYELKPGRGDLISVVKLRQWSDEFNKEQPELAAKMRALADELEKDVISYSKADAEEIQGIENELKELEGE